MKETRGFRQRCRFEDGVIVHRGTVMGPAATDRMLRHDLATSKNGQRQAGNGRLHTGIAQDVVQVWKVHGPGQVWERVSMTYADHCDAMRTLDSLSGCQAVNVSVRKPRGWLLPEGDAPLKSRCVR